VRHEVAADAAVPVERESDLELGANTIDRRDEHWIAQAKPIKGVESTEASKVAENLWTMCCVYGVTHGALRTISGVKIYASLRVGVC
jgi:hypothetical protein